MASAKTKTVITAALAAGVLAAAGTGDPGRTEDPHGTLTADAVAAAWAPVLTAFGVSAVGSGSGGSAPTAVVSFGGNPIGTAAPARRVAAVMGTGARAPSTATSGGVSNAFSAFFAPARLPLKAPSTGGSRNGAAPALSARIGSAGAATAIAPGTGGEAWLGLIGPSGLLIGNGLDGDEPGENGGNGGLLWGNGGAGAPGAEGQAGGNGGNGGLSSATVAKAVPAVLAQRAIKAATPGY